MASVDDLIFADSDAPPGPPPRQASVDDLVFAEGPPAQTQQPPGPPPTDDGFSFAEMARNVPGSFAGLVGDTAQAVMNPIDTGKGLIHTLGGLFAKALPGDTISEDAADPVINFFKSRYGSKKAFLETAESDPMGVVADVAAFMSATGGALRGTRAGQIISTAGRFSDPVGMGLVATRNAGRIAQSAASTFYQRAAKFSTNIPLDVVDDATRQLLEKNIPIGGVDKLRAVITEEGAKLGAILSEADNAGVRVRTKPIINSIDKIIAEAERAFGGKSAQNVKALHRMREELIQQFGNKPTIKPSELQASKLDISKDIKFDATDVGGKSTSPTARVEQDALIAQRSEMKGMLEAIDKNIASINNSLGPLLEIEDSFGRATRRIGNRNLFSNVVSTGVGGFTGGSAIMAGATTPEALAVGVLAAAGIELARSPAVVSRAAIKLNNVVGRPLEAVGNIAGNPFALAAAQAIATHERGRPE